MNELEQLYAQAEKRRLGDRLNYAGAVSPVEAFQLLQLDPRARLVDVRTQAELDWIGKPIVGDGQYAHVEWASYPGSKANQQFMHQLSDIAAGAPLLLLCRSAVRTKLAAAAATQAGFTNVFDVLEGFEGDKDSHGHRKTVSGWCFRGLPWVGA